MSGGFFYGHFVTAYIDNHEEGINKSRKKVEPAHKRSVVEKLKKLCTKLMGHKLQH